MEPAMKKRQWAAIVLLVLCMLFLLGGCVPHRVASADAAGFFTGIWHGWIAPVSLVLSLFGDYQIYEAKCMGADAVLLICALLPTETIREYLKICDDLGLTALVETHDENEIRSALKAGARVIGVNNRNLKNFTVDFSNAANLREQIPTNVIFVAESGVKEPQDVGVLAEIGADAVLIGEALMRAEDKTERLAEFKQAAVQGREKAAEQVQTSDAQSQASDGGKA